MEKFKTTLKYRMLFCCIFIVVGVILSIYNGFFNPVYAGENQNDAIVESFIFGLVISFEVMSVWKLQKYRKAYHDDRKLKLLYNDEHDERKSLIRSKSGMPFVVINSMIIIIIAIIASKFNIIVFRTMIGVVLAQLIISIFVKLYYSIKL